MPDCAVTLCVGEVQRLEIPRGAFIVKTRNSIYRFGRANKKGARSIKRISTNQKHNLPLEFSKCVVLDLAIGEQMQVRCLNGPKHFQEGGWHTSIVLNVEKVC